MGTLTSLEKSLRAWGRMTESQQIREMRKILGLPPLTQKPAICIQCGKEYQAQYIGKRRVNFDCGRYHAEKEFL